MEKTGIAGIAVDTVGDWIELARRRGLVSPWIEEPTGVVGSPPATKARWVGTEDRGSAVVSRLTSAALRAPLGSVLGIVFGGSGILGALRWLQDHQTALAVIGAAVAVALYLGVILLVGGIVKRRFGPSAALVVIETLRSDERQLPSLSPPAPAIAD